MYLSWTSSLAWPGTRTATPFHVARKSIEHFDLAAAPPALAKTNVLKFERFIFDVLPHAANPLVIEVDRSESFAPLKNAEGAAEHTPEHVRAAISARAKRWLGSLRGGGRRRARRD